METIYFWDNLLLLQLQVPEAALESIRGRPPIRMFAGSEVLPNDSEYHSWRDDQGLVDYMHVDFRHLDMIIERDFLCITIWIEQEENAKTM